MHKNVVGTTRYKGCQLRKVRYFLNAGGMEIEAKYI